MPGFNLNIIAKSLSPEGDAVQNRFEHRKLGFGVFGLKILVSVPNEDRLISPPAPLPMIFNDLPYRH